MASQQTRFLVHVNRIAPDQYNPSRLRRHGYSNLGFLLMLSGASIVFGASLQPPTSSEFAFAGFVVLLLGSVLVMISIVDNGIPRPVTLLVEVLRHQEPNCRHGLEETSLHRYGLLLMLFGASMVIFTISSSSANREHALLGVALLICGFMLLGLSEFRGLRAAERLSSSMMGSLGNFFSRGLGESMHRYGLLLMSLGASMVMFTLGSSSTWANLVNVFLGFSLVIFGFVLLVLLEFRGSRAA